MPAIIGVPLMCISLGLLLAVIGRFKNIVYGGRPALAFWKEWTVYSCGMLLAVAMAYATGQIR
jgi:hypothetical protein